VVCGSRQFSHTSVRSDRRRPTLDARALLAAFAVTLWGIVQSHAYDAEISDAFAAFSLRIPTPASVVICHGIGCARRTEIGLGKGDHSKLAALLATGKASAAAERGAVATAIAWFDRRVGPEAGTTKRIARASAMTQSGPGQMDCIDTSRNTTSYLVILDQLRLLRFHQIEAPVARGFITSPHATAVLRETKSGQKWAIDNWTRKYGEKPDVMPLDMWMAAD
jgi:hypothetical protein